MIVRKCDDGGKLFNRRGFDWTHRFPLIVEALAALKATSVTIDGEAVWCEPKTGLSVFDKLHSQAHNAHVFLYAFDLLELDGEDLRPMPLEVRKGKAPQDRCARPPWPSLQRSTSTATAIGSTPTPAARRRGHRLQASRCAVSLGSHQGLAEDQESDEPGGHADRG